MNFGAAMIGAIVIGQALEAGMLICFGISWPVDILRTLSTRRTEGKSIAFMSLVLSGYILGMGAKFARASAAGVRPELITLLYVFNGVMIIIDIVVTLRLRRMARRQGLTG